MPATITVVPDEPRIGQSVVVSGSGFAPNTAIALDIEQYGITAHAFSSDVNGDCSSTNLPAKATGTLTSDGTIPTANDTVTIGTHTYKFVVTPAAAGDVALGADAAHALINLKAAMLGDAHNVANADVIPGAIDATTLAMHAAVGGVAGNALATTEASTHLSFGGTHLNGGAAADGGTSVLFTPSNDNPIDITLSDGTNEASIHLRVFDSE